GEPTLEVSSLPEIGLATGKNPLSASDFDMERSPLYMWWMKAAVDIKSKIDGSLWTTSQTMVIFSQSIEKTRRLTHARRACPGAERPPDAGIKRQAGFYLKLCEAPHTKLGRTVPLFKGSEASSGRNFGAVPAVFFSRLGVKDNGNPARSCQA